MDISVDLWKPMEIYYFFLSHVAAVCRDSLRHAKTDIGCTNDAREQEHHRRVLDGVDGRYFRRLAAPSAALVL